MAKDITRVLITDAEYPDLTLELDLLTEAGLEVIQAQCRTPQEVIDAGKGCEALLVQYAPVPREVFEALPDLRIVSRAGVGVDSVDVEAARDHGVFVANVPDYGVEEVAAHAIGMSLSLIRQLPFLDRQVRSGTWGYYTSGPLTRPSLQTLGLAGMGRIGRTVAVRALPWFQRVVGYDPFLSEDHWPEGVERVDLDELFKRSNCLSLHLPLTEESQNLVDEKRLAAMPEGSYLVNTARGGLVDVVALVEALDGGRLAGAALDVLPQEPPPGDHPLLRHPRVMLTPHAAFYSEQAAVEMRSKAVLNVVEWSKFGKPLYTVVEGRSE